MSNNIYINNYPSQQEERFSLFKTAKSATLGVGAVTLAKIGLDYFSRNSITADELKLLTKTNLTEEEKIAAKNIKNIMENTKYIEKLKHYVSNPKETFNKTKEYLKDTYKNTNLESIKKGATDIWTRGLNRLKSFKGNSIKETLKNAYEYSKTVKGKQAVLLFGGTLLGLLLFGTKKTVNKEKNRSFIG